MYQLARSLLFSLNAETAHHLGLSMLHYLPDFCFAKPRSMPVNVMGLAFPHPVGLAAGFDKNGEHLQALAKLGFSFIEVGTVTPRAQLGNEKPRLFRLPSADAIINRMGFNNLGVDVLVANVEKADFQGILGINIGKNKDTPLQQAAEDYLYCLRKVYRYASYVTINISSPNTPDLRQLQQRDYLSNLLSQLREEQLQLADMHQFYVPLVVKISPDESDEQLKQIGEIVLSFGLDGMIATNTTCERAAVQHVQYGNEQGGLSGPPLLEQSTHCLKILKEVVGEQVTLIGSGGIDNPHAAAEKLQAGASLVQVYTGLIYQGPDLVKTLVDGLVDLQG